MNRLAPFGVAFLAVLLFAEPVTANIIVPIGGGVFLVSLFFLFTTPAFVIILLPVVIGLFFHRKFIAMGNFIALAAVIIFAAIIEGLLIRQSVAPLIILAFLYASFFTIIAFLSSLIGKQFQKIRNVQEIFERIDKKVRLVILGVLYGIVIAPLVYVANVRPSSYSSSVIIIIGDLVSVAAFVLLFQWMYKKARSLPKKDIIYEKKDHLYFWLLVIIFVITFVSPLT